jgi:hypothetical protein
MKKIPDGIWSLVRSLLTTAGGGAVATGWLTSDELTSIVGGVVALLSAAWGAYVRYGTRQVSETTAQRTDVPTVSAVTGRTIPGTQYTG